MNRHERKLFSSRNPKEYIENSLKCKLTPGQKARITRLWLNNHQEYDIEDIKHARNIHPHWKSKKMAGSYERNERRKEMHNYAVNGPVIWDDQTILEFIEMNQKDRSGNYLYKDHELAHHFATTIPGIQHYRRKYNMALRLLAMEQAKPTKKRIQKLISQSETKLRRHLRSV